MLQRRCQPAHRWAVIDNMQVTMRNYADKSIDDRACMLLRDSGTRGKLDRQVDSSVTRLTDTPVKRFEALSVHR